MKQVREENVSESIQLTEQELREFLGLTQKDSRRILVIEREYRTPGCDWIVRLY